MHPTAFFPAGKAQLVVRLQTGSYRGTIVKKFPFVVDNPNYGAPIEELPATGKLRAANPAATVIELFNGAPVPGFGPGGYDGARDVYFARNPNCSGRGTSVNYFTDYRTQLKLGNDGGNGVVLIKYDLGMLAGPVKVRAARLMLYVRKLAPKTAPACRVFGIRKRWHELMIDPRGPLTGGYSRGALSRAKIPVGGQEFWDKPMLGGAGDRHAGAVTSHTFSRTGWAAIDVTSAVRNWVTGKWVNHGLVLEVTDPKEYVHMWASDYRADPRRRPRLVLVLEGPWKTAPHKVKESSGDLAAALRKARAQNRPVLCNILSAGSITSRNLESNVLGNPAVKRYIDERFVEVRIDGRDPRHGQLLKTYDVRNLPTALILSPAAGGRDFERIEPLAWNARFGVTPTCFEFEQSYTALLGRALAQRRRWGHFPYRREPSGQVRRYTNRVHGGCKFGPSGGLLKRK